MADGIEFPLDDEGKRPTTGINQGAFAAAVKEYDEKTHQDVAQEKKWRFGYAKHVVRQTQLAAKSTEAALGIAQAGLSYLHANMVFLRGGESKPLLDAMKAFQESTFESHVVKGTGTLGDSPLEVPYQGRTLRGEEVKAQVEAWVRRGVIELDTGAALSLVASNKGWLDLRDYTFVLFGAGSAMGPLPILLSLGAHVIALDLDRPVIWQRLLALARSSPGTLTVPLKAAAPAGATDEAVAALAGCNLLTQTPEVRNWLLTLLPGKKAVLGAYCYADGPLFVRVSVAMDVIIADLVQRLPEKPAVAYLCTPTDAHVCTASACNAANENLRKASWWQPPLGLALGFAKMGLVPNRVKIEDGALPVVDAIVKEQGPNYCLAKRIQHWRAVISRKHGCIVSTNIAPATSTASVVSNKSFALAYKGMHHFRPMEVFHQETSNVVMAALLVHDLRNPLSAAHPSTPLTNPMQLFSATAFHGGAWRIGYKFGTIGPASAIAFICSHYLSKTYLILYSLVQLLGWAYALQTFSTQEQKVGIPLAANTIIRFTYLQLLEVAHAALGIVPSSPVITAMQIGSRVLIAQVMYCGVNDSNRDKVAFWMLLFFVAWTITEVVRYTYYMLNTAGIQVTPLTWLRYSTFLVLYPLGVTGELGFLHSAMPRLSEISSGTPGCGVSGSCGHLAALSFHLGIVGCLAVYAACFPLLYGTMLSQRRKVLGRRGGKRHKSA